MCRILGITPHDWYGVRRALSAITPDYSAPADALTRLETDRPDVVVFGCYLPEWKPILDAARRLGCRTVLTWYASYILNEFDHRNRLWMTAALREAKNGYFDFVATPYTGLAVAWSHFGIPTDVLPPTVTTTLTPIPKRAGMHIGVLGSSQPWKNMDTQVIAASMIPDAIVHVQKMHRTEAIRVLGITPTVHDHFASDDDYHALVGSMRINLTVSMSETFSFLTAESLLLGTPVVTSSVTPIFADAPPELSVCRISQFDDPVCIRDTMHRVLNKYDEIVRVGRDHMLDLNVRNRVLANAVIDRWSSS